MKQYCKECIQLKDLSEYYKHPEWKNWVLWRCKECIKSWRKWDREREMARERDNKYYATKTETRERIRLHSIDWRERNPLKRKAHILVCNYLKKPNSIKPTECSNCGSEKRIHLHHEDYSKPKETIPLCQRCHLWYHAGHIEIDKTKTFNIP